MNELRKDPFTGKEVIMAVLRNHRPSDLRVLKEEEEVEKHNEYCAFCIGNEKYTTDTILERRENQNWNTRLFKNKYPIFNEEYIEDSELIVDGLYEKSSAYGYHDVVVECNIHNGTFFNMSEKEFYNYIDILKERLSLIKEDKKIKYIGILKNYKKEAAASLRHPHSQIVAMDFISHDIKNKLNIAREYYKKNGESLYIKVINYEIERNERIIYNGKYFLALAPYASLNPGGVKIIYKGKKPFYHLDDFEVKELSYIFYKLYKNVMAFFGDIPFNLAFTLTPLKEDVSSYFNWHIDFIPRNGFLGGFEFSTGVAVNGLLPEVVAEKLKFN